jgi:hypothetical protein
MLAAEALAACISKPSRACPTPTKIRMTSRGSAFRCAILAKQYPYLCVCGTYHLTSQRKSGRWCEASLAELATVLDPRLVQRNGDRFMQPASSRRRRGKGSRSYLRHSS